MKIKNRRGLRIPTRIFVSGILLVIQLFFLFSVVYNLTAQSATAYIITTILAAITVIVIINRRGNPDHKITWIVFILVFPLFGITVFLLWGGGRVLPHIKKKMRVCESHYMPFLEDDSAVMQKLKYYDLIHSRQAEYLTRESGYPLYDRTLTEFVSPGEAFLPRLLDELRAAERYIFIEFFILAEGAMWNQIYEILKEKAQNGVEVKIIFDDFGSIKRQSKTFISSLRKNNISVSIFNPINPIMNIFMNNRNHRKIVVIDGKVAITGGINIGDEYINREERFGYWLDSAIIIKGDAVKSFLVMFCNMWEFITGKKIDIPTHDAYAPCFEEGFVVPYCDGPLSNQNLAEGIYMQILSTAQKYVYIATPYLIIDNTMKSVIQMAAKSGIDVRIIVPHIPDKWYVHPATQYNYLELLESGVRIYEYAPGFIHSKLFVSDDKVATVGTINMDYRSFVFHFECGVWICDNSTVLDIKDHFEEILPKCKEIKIEEWKKRPIKDRIKQEILHIFAPFM